MLEQLLKDERVTWYVYAVSFRAKRTCSYFEIRSPQSLGRNTLRRNSKDVQGGVACKPSKYLLPLLTCPASIHSSKANRNDDLRILKPIL